MSKTEEQLYEEYPSLLDKEAALVFLSTIDGMPVGEFSSLLRYLYPDMFENVMINVRKGSLEGGSLLLYRKVKPLIITMVIQDGPRKNAQMSYIHTCFKKIEANLEKIKVDNFYLSQRAFDIEKQELIKTNFKNLNLFFV